MEIRPDMTPSAEESAKTASVMKGRLHFKHPCVSLSEMDALISMGVQPSQLSLYSEHGPFKFEWIECRD